MLVAIRRSGRYRIQKRGTIISDYTEVDIQIKTLDKQELSHVVGIPKS